MIGILKPGRTFGWVIVFVGAGALVALLVGLLATGLGLLQEVRKTQTEGTPTGRRIVALQESSNAFQTEILDCVRPTGECAQRGQEKQATIVQTLNLGALYAVYCVDRNPEASVAQVQACVQRLYAEQPRSVPELAPAPGPTPTKPPSSSKPEPPVTKPTPGPKPTKAPQPTPTPRPTTPAPSPTPNFVETLLDQLLEDLKLPKLP